MLQGKQHSPTEREQKDQLIGCYIEKFAIIANRTVTQAMYNVYMDALSDIELRKLRKGLDECLRCCTSFPFPGVIREFCEDEV